MVRAGQQCRADGRRRAEVREVEGQGCGCLVPVESCRTCDSGACSE